MNLKNLFPFANDHSIQACAVALEWGDGLPASSLSAEDLAKATEVSAPLLEGWGFTSREPLQRLQVQFGPSQLPQAVPSLVGFRAVKQVQGRAGRTIALDPDSLVVQLDDYTRWHDAQRDLATYLNALLPLLCNWKAVRRVSLQVVDLFTWRGPRSEFDLTQVFRTGSRWLPPHAFELKNNLWHAHHGFFQEYREPLHMQQLDNVNIAVAQNPEQQLTVQTQLFHQGQLPAEGHWARDPAGVAPLLQALNKFHEDNKAVLREVFSDPVLERIKLNAPTQH